MHDFIMCLKKTIHSDLVHCLILIYLTPNLIYAVVWQLKKTKTTKKYNTIVLKKEKYWCRACGNSK